MITVLCTNAYKAAQEVAITKGSELPVLNHALLYTDNGRLNIVTCALTEAGKEVKRATIPARVDTEFRTCVPMYHKSNWVEYSNGKRVHRTLTTHPFTDWLKVTQNKGKDTPDQIELTLDEKCQVLHIKAGNTRAEFKCIDAQEFPVIN